MNYDEKTIAFDGPDHTAAQALEADLKLSAEINVEEYYLRYAPMVMRRCRRMLGNEERARDALQEVFVRLLTYRHRLRPGHPSSLLFRMATNICLNMIRDERPPSFSDRDPLVENIAATDEVEPRAVFRDLLAKILGREKSSTREMVYFHFVDGMTFREVARETGYSASGVRKRIGEFLLRAGAKKEVFHGR